VNPLLTLEPAHIGVATDVEALQLSIADALPFFVLIAAMTHAMVSDAFAVLGAPHAAGKWSK
jgi:hypothetical protein